MVIILSKCWLDTGVQEKAIFNVGKMTSIPSVIKYYKSKNRKADYSTISSYISYLDEAFILHQASRYSLKTKELLSGEKKYFLNDLA
ncbi:MAG: ATP-binding protein [Bacteroidia bacterium]|nr:ATP-binding protein [Bacteroidia bacterium]